MNALTTILKAGVLCAAMAMGAASAQAQDAPTASHLEAARAALAAINATDQFDAVLMNAATQVKGELIPNHPDRQDELSDMVDDAAIELAPRRAELENQIAEIYATIFSEEELGEISGFYASPAGEKLIQQGPLATREMLALAEVWANGVVRDLRTVAVERARQIVPSAASPAAPAAPAQ